MKTSYEDRFQKFLDFHKENPVVWEYFKKFAFELINHGYQHYSARGIWHRIRWQTAIAASLDGSGNFERIKLSDHHTPFYARIFMQKYPQHDGFFRTKPQK